MLILAMPFRSGEKVYLPILVSKYGGKLTPIWIWAMGRYLLKDHTYQGDVHVPHIVGGCLCGTVVGIWKSGVSLQMENWHSPPAPHLKCVASDTCQVSCLGEGGHVDQS